MSRAYGWNASLLIAEESKYGILPENGYRQIPFISTSLDSEQSLVSSNVLGLGRDPTQPFQDVINVDGDMAVPVDMRNIGVWLKAIFGTPTTIENDDGSYSHAFESGKPLIFFVNPRLIWSNIKKKFGKLLPKILIFSHKQKKFKIKFCF